MTEKAPTDPFLVGLIVTVIALWLEHKSGWFEPAGQDPPKVIEQNETGHGIGPSAWTPVGEPQTVRAKQEAILAIQNQMFVQRLINVGIAAGMIVAVILGGIELASQGNEIVLRAGFLSWLGVVRSTGSEQESTMGRRTLHRRSLRRMSSRGAGSAFCRGSRR